MGHNVSTDRQSSPRTTRTTSRTASPPTSAPPNSPRRQDVESSLEGSVSELAPYQKSERSESSDKLDFEEYALAEVGYHLPKVTYDWRDGVGGSFRCHLEVDYRSAHGGWIRSNLKPVLKRDSSKHYHVEFGENEAGKLIVRFVPKEPVLDWERSASKLAAFLGKLERIAPEKTHLNLKAVTVTHDIDGFKFSCDFDELDPELLPAPVLICVVSYLRETYCAPAGEFKNVPCESKGFSNVSKIIEYPWCDKSMDIVSLQTDFQDAMHKICANLNFLTNNGYTGEEIAKFDHLGEITITEHDLSCGTKKVPRMIGMGGLEFANENLIPKFKIAKLQGFWIHLANITPGSALSKEVAHIATDLMCQLFVEKRKVKAVDTKKFSSKRFGENSTHLKVSGKPETKNGSRAGDVYDVIFFCIARELRRWEIDGMAQDEIAANPDFAKTVKKLVLSRLGVNEADEPIIDLDD